MDIANVTSVVNDTQSRSIAELVVGTATLVIIIMMTICGNILVILSIFTYRPLNKVQNFFLVSLACADLAVGTLVMPFHVVKFITDVWPFGKIMCLGWITMDILLCTSSILNLCAIALDRYWAIHDPLGYAKRRTLNLVLLMIAAVWILSTLISVPPLLGWNDWSGEGMATRCEYTTERSFVVYSACGSFYIPLVIMTVVYVKIFSSARQRLKKRAKGHLSTEAPKPEFNGIRSRGLRRFNFTSVMRVLRRQSSEVQMNAGDEYSSEEESPAESRANMSMGRRETLAMLTLTIQQNCLVTQLATLETAGRGDETTPPEDSGVESQFIGKPIIEQKVSLDPNNIDVADRSPSPARSASSPKKSTTSEKRPTIKRKTRRRTKKGRGSAGKSNYGTTETPAQKLQGQANAMQDKTMLKFYKDKERISVSKEKKAAKTLAIIMGVFVLCWLPFFILYVVQPFCNCTIHAKIFEATNWLGYINSSLNPVIYTIFNMDFRRAFKKILTPVKNKILSCFKCTSASP